MVNNNWQSPNQYDSLPGVMMKYQQRHHKLQCTVLVKIKTHISCFMEKLPECKIWNFMEKKKLPGEMLEKNEM